MESQIHYQEQIQSLTNEVQQIRSTLNRLSETSSLHRVQEEQLQHCLSLLKTVIETMEDGLLVVDSTGKIASFNQKFTEMWHIPYSLVGALDDNKLLAFVVDQLKDPEVFLAKVRELYSNPDHESFDVLEFKDGQVFERFSKPQRWNEKIIGRVWGFRNATDRIKTEKLLKQLTSRNTYLSLATNSLFRSLDLDDLLKSIQRALIPKIADTYSIDIIDANDRIRCIDFFYPDSALSKAGKELRQKFPFDLLAPTGVPRVFRSGKSEIYSETSDLILREAFPHELFSPVLEKLKIYSVMLVPLVIRGRVFGVVSLMSSSADRHFLWEDLRLSEEVCARISVALDNAFSHIKTEEAINSTLPIRAPGWRGLLRWMVRALRT